MKISVGCQCGKVKGEAEYDGECSKVIIQVVCQNCHVSDSRTGGLVGHPDEIVQNSLELSAVSA